MPFTVATTGLTQFCPPTDKAAETVLCQVSIFAQCLPINPVPPANAPLLLTVSPEDMVGGGQGVQPNVIKRVRPIQTAASETEVANTYTGLDAMWTFQLQRGAMGRTIDEITEGVKYLTSTVLTGHVEMKFADRSGQLVPTYSVLFSYHSGGALIYKDWAPNCEISITAQGTMGASQNFNKTVQIKAQSIGDDIGTRFIRYIAGTI